MKIFFVVVGTLALVLGIIGIFLPILPTTPFLLLTAFCYYKGSGNLYNKLMDNKYLGSYIRDFRENKTIPLHTKIVAISMLWGTISLSICFGTKLLWLRILLAVIAIAVTIHICSFRTK